MIKANIVKGIVETAGNDMDFIQEHALLTWEVKNALPEGMHQSLRESFEKAMEAEECPEVMPEEDFTRQMREMLGAKNEPKKVETIDAEDVEYLFRKIEAAKEKGHFIALVYDTLAGIKVLVVHRESEKDERCNVGFDICLNQKEVRPEAAREEYDKCIEYLTELAAE